MKPAILPLGKSLCFLAAAMFMGLVAFVPAVTLLRMAVPPNLDWLAVGGAFFLSLLVCAVQMLFLVREFGMPIRGDTPADAAAPPAESDWPEF